MSNEQTGNEHSARQLNMKDWVRLYADQLYTYAKYRVNGSEEARDLVQDTFLSALKASDTFNGLSNEKTWLLSILKNKIIDYYRKKSRQSISESFDSLQIASAYDDYFEASGDSEGHWNYKGRPKQWAENAYQQLEIKEFYETLNKCLSLLPQKWEAVFRLKNLEDTDTETICKELNVSASNYWIIMHRAKLQLRKCMEMNWLGI